MSVADFDNVGADAAKHWRDEYRIPFGRVGTAIDYAQCIISVIVVSSSWPSGLGSLVSSSDTGARMPT